MQVAARRFCLVAADHPLVSAISESESAPFEPLPSTTVALIPHFVWPDADKLQMGEISQSSSSEDASMYHSLGMRFDDVLLCLFFDSQDDA